MRLLAALLSLSVALLLAQTTNGARRRSKGRADAGPGDAGPLYLGPDAPGRLKPDPPARDGGPRVPTVDSIPDGGSAQQLQMQEMRARISLLEQQLASSQQQVQQMAAMNSQLQALRDQLAATDSANRQQQAQEAARKEAVSSAINSLGAAQEQLALGNSSIGDALDQAQSNLSGQAQRDVQVAREALRNGDLSQARAYLNAAISDAQQGK